MALIWIDEFKNNAIYRIDENVRMISIALSKIQEAEIWTRHNQSLNTLGNQILHICGNMTQYAISGLTGTEDRRDRDKEFSLDNEHSSDELLKLLLQTTQKATTVIKNATEEQLLLSYGVQGFDFSGIGLVMHAVEHFSYHTGQIAFQVKLTIDEPLGFYEGLDLNKKNQQSKEDED